MIEDAEYTDAVSFRIKVPYEESGAFIKEITEATAGKALIEKEKNLYYMASDKEL